MHIQLYDGAGIHGQNPIFLMHGFYPKGKHGWLQGTTVIAPEVAIPAIPGVELTQA